MKLKNLLRWKRNRRETPTWNRVAAGPAHDCQIFVAAGQPNFGEMVAGTYDAYFWQFLREVELQGKTILDIGGHIGYHTMCFARLCGAAGEVHAFEPNPANLARLKLHLENNTDLQSIVQIHPYALSDSTGSTTFNLSLNVDNQTSSGGFVEGSYKPLADEVYRRAGFREIEVQLNTLDAFVVEKKIKNLALLKIDVEGAEHFVLRGGRETLKHYQPTILMEIHSVTAMLHVCKVFHELGYAMDILEEDGISRCFVAARPLAQGNSQAAA